ncbi:hypothetical protein SAG0136_10060 [Streptococcus agalactiae LMG 14747]|uniref:Uncharacterized protein n=1 Tax=Streptococcus agalactiae LMG 14747 TaxID=1154860 RepID=V6Z3P6_STRAG|nr:hypothetical protein SAG0136_10060 [Streptococcus agalactiae LMG 14747]
MSKHQKLLASLLLLAFFLGLLAGRYRQQLILKDPAKAYQVTTEDKQTGEEVIFQVQRFDDQRIKIQLSTGEVFASQITDKRENGAWVIELPDNGGKLALQQSLLPWKEAQLGILTSEKYRTVDNTSKVVMVSEPNSLETNDLTENQPKSETTVRTKLNLNAKAIDQVIEGFGKWLYDSSYGRDAVVVRGSFNDLSESIGEPVSVQAFKVDNLTVFAGLSGDDMTGFDNLDHQIQSYSTSLLDLNLKGKTLADFQTKAAFRVYYHPSGHHYYASVKEEKERLVRTSYADFYQNQVDDQEDSLHFVLANNGRVYYAKEYGLVGSVTYTEAPSEMQSVYNDLLGKAKTD